MTDKELTGKIIKLFGLGVQTNAALKLLTLMVVHLFVTLGRRGDLADFLALAEAGEDKIQEVWDKTKELAP
jgi:hypothetical protein